MMSADKFDQKLDFISSFPGKIVPKFSGDICPCFNVDIFLRDYGVNFAVVGPMNRNQVHWISESTELNEVFEFLREFLS